MAKKYVDLGKSGYMIAKISEIMKKYSWPLLYQYQPDVIQLIDACRWRQDRLTL